MRLTQNQWPQIDIPAAADEKILQLVAEATYNVNRGYL
jgi:hypothetical protein